MAARNSKRKKADKKTRQFTLLEMKDQRSNSDGKNVPLVIDLDDDDPYKFVGTQSLEVDSMPSKRPLPRKPATPQRGCDSSIAGGGGVSVRGGSTPQNLKQTTPKTKKSPGSSSLFTESERLRLKEEEDVKRAIEASLQDQQRGNRLRRRKDNEEESEQNEIYQSIQKEIKKAHPILTDTESASTAGASKSVLSEDDQEQTADFDKGHSQVQSVPTSPRVLLSSQQLKSVSVKKLSMMSVRSKKRESEQLETIRETVVPTTTAITGATTTSGAPESSSLINEEESEQEYNDVQVISADEEDATPPLSEYASPLKEALHEDDDIWDFGHKTSVVDSAKTDDIRPEVGSNVEMDVSVKDDIGVSKCQLNKELAKMTVSSDSNDTTVITENVKTTSEYKPVRKSRSSMLRLTKDRKRGYGVSYQEANTPHSCQEEPTAKRQKMEIETVMNHNKDKSNVIESKEAMLVDKSSHDCSIVEPTVDQSSHKADSTHTSNLSKERKKETPKKRQEVIPAENVTSKRQLSMSPGDHRLLKLSTKSSQLQQKNIFPSNFPTVRDQTKGLDVVAPLPSTGKKPVVRCSSNMVTDFSIGSTSDIIQKFDSYFERLGGAQRRVLWRLKWGNPVTVAKKSSNSLSVERSRRLLRSNVDYPLSVVELETRPSRRSKSGRLSRQPPTSTGNDGRISPQLHVDDDTDTDDIENAVTVIQEVCDVCTKEKTSPPPDEEMDTLGEDSPRAGGDESDVDVRDDQEEFVPLSPPSHDAADDATLLSDDQQQSEVDTENQKPPTEAAKNDIIPAATSTTASFLPLNSSDSDFDFDFPPRVKKLRGKNEIAPSSPSTQSSATNTQETAHKDVIVISTQSDSPTLSAPKLAAPTLTAPRSDSIFDDLRSQTFSPSPDRDIPSDYMDSESDDVGVPLTKASSAAAWLSSRKGTPMSMQKKAPATKKTVKGKSRTTSPKGKGKGKGKGKQVSSKPLSAAARMRNKSAQVNDESCTSEFMSSGEDAPVIKPTKTNLRRHSKQFSALNDSSDDDLLNPYLENSKQMTKRAQQKRETDTNKSKKGSVIDLTADTQIPMDSSPSPSPSEELVDCPICQRKFNASTIQMHAAHCTTSVKGKHSCPMCKKWFDVTVIQVHADQCNGHDSGGESSAATRGHGSSVAGRKSVGQHSYQPNLKSLVDKRNEVDEIDSSETESEGGKMEHQYDNEGGFLLGELDAALNSESSSSKHTSSKMSSVDVESDSAASRSTGKEFQAIPCSDGGFIVDPSAVSSSPLKTFTKISELDPKERASFQNQFTSKSKQRKGRKRQLYQGSSAGMRRDWSSSDQFDSLMESSQGKSGRGRGGGGKGRKMSRGRGGYGTWGGRWNRKRGGY